MAADDVMADLDVPNIPATILTLGTIINIAMNLCMDALVNWKDVADKLGFTYPQIEGHFSNFRGCEPARNMLNEWIFKRGGKIPKLVEVFKVLELYSCLEELLADKEYQAACEFFKNRHDDDDNDDASSGTSSISDESSVLTTTSNDAIKSDSLISSENTSLQLEYDDKVKQHNKTKVYKKRSDKKVPTPKSPGSACITYTDWPTSSSDKKPEYNRCDSEPKENIRKKPFFRRSISADSGRTKQKETKDKQTKNNFKTFLKQKLKIHGNSKKKQDSGELFQVHVQGYYQEDKTKETTNLSPVAESAIPESIDRPLSSGSEDSLSPSSPNSLGYESGSECEVVDNQSKRIYIVCNPGEPAIFSKAYQLYQEFCAIKRYQCNLFATNFDEVLEIGHYRYEMQQVLRADYLFLCVSEQLHKIFQEPLHTLGGLKDDNSKSLRHVSDFMMSALARECCNKNGKFMTILLAEDSHDHVPDFLGQYLVYKWPEQEAKMENTIHRRSEYPTIPVSSSKVQATQKVIGLKKVKYVHSK